MLSWQIRCLLSDCPGEIAVAVDGEHVAKSNVFQTLPTEGVLYVGTKGSILFNSNKPQTPTVKVLDPVLDAKARSIPVTLPRRRGWMFREWLEACQGGEAATCNFDFAQYITEFTHLGNLAIRAGDAALLGGALVGGNTAERDAAYNGMEIQILDDTGSLKQRNKAWQYCGSIYGVVAAQKGHLRPVGEWNDYDVTAVGESVTVVLNGVTILATSVKDLDTKGGTPDGKPHPGLHNRTGYLGFLGHTMPVRMRNIRVREL